MAKQVEILFVCGSPRSHTSEALLALLEQGAHEAGARSQRFLLSAKRIAPCTGCGFCTTTGTCVQLETGQASPNPADHESQSQADQTAANQANHGEQPRDNYAELLEALAHADALAVVSPLYFAGPPAQLKALFDRMQPFWAQRYRLGHKPAPKKPAQVFIVGEGGDTHGYEPLVGSAKSALNVAGFAVEKVQNFVGFRHPDDVTPLPSEAEAANLAFGERAHVRKAVALQREFEQRAAAAGGAFARFVRKSMEKQELQAELRLIEAEIEEFKTAEPVATTPSEHGVLSGAEPHRIVNFVDEGFEALKLSAQARKESGKAPLAGAADSDAGTSGGAGVAGEASPAKPEPQAANPASPDL